MYPLTPLKTYALERVYEDERCVARMERILKAASTRPEDVCRITEKNLPDVVKELAELWPPAAVPPGQVRSFMRPLVFTTMDLSYNRPDLTPMLERCAPGPLDFVLRNIYGQMIPAIDQHPHEVWDELKLELGQDPRNYICGCSSVAVPGRRLALSPGLRYSTYNQTPV